MPTKLEAVNRLLHSLKQRPLSSLDGTLNDDHLAAVRAIDQTTREVQAEGWSFNTDRDVTLEPGDDGRIVLPNKWLSYVISPRRSRTDPRDYAVRNGAMYHTHTQSDQFTSGLTFDLILFQLDYDDLPPVPQEYIAIRAQREFLYNLQRDQALAVPGQQELQYRANLMREYIASNSPNVFRDPNTRETAGEPY